MRQSQLPQDLPARHLRRERGASEWLRAVNGFFLARPWFDRAALFMLGRYYFPLSRIWAAAAMAGSDVDRLVDEARLRSAGLDRRRLGRALFQYAATREIALAMDRRWEDCFFGDGTVRLERLVAVETARRDCRHRFELTRRCFRPFLKFVGEIVRQEPPTPLEVEQIYGAALDDRKDSFRPPDPMPVVECSQRVAGPSGWEHWLRFRSPSQRVGDTVYAHVFEPPDVGDPPTLIFGHGVCVETDHWHGLIDEVETLVSMGIRVVRPEAPWHGRRAPAGRYGGEVFVGRSPLGPLDTFTAALQEWSVLMNWCRATGNGPVAMGGSSMGALMSQLAADVSRDWPGNLQPDALLLITHCGRHQEAVVEGKLAQLWGIGEALREAGWSQEKTVRYLSLLDPVPTRAPVVAPENIVSVLGRRDNVTPFAGGMALLDAWRIPQENRFIWDRGHFTVPMTMIRDQQPLLRFRDRMLALAQ